jgi:hypothetical protein
MRADSGQINEPINPLRPTLKTANEQNQSLQNDLRAQEISDDGQGFRWVWRTPMNFWTASVTWQLFDFVTCKNGNGFD